MRRPRGDNANEFILQLHISNNAPYPPPPQILNNLCFSLLLVLQPTQENLKTMLMQNFGGANKVHYGKCASGELSLLA